MRVQNSIRNMFFGLTGQIVSMLMSFIVRTTFIYSLGVEYLGIEGLFTSILIMLSLANLGFDTALIYSLYTPLQKKDIRKIQALMNLYKKAYRIIGVIVLAIGLSLIPFLPYIMNGKTSIPNINFIFLLFLLNSVSSYFLAYKHSIIVADQKNYIISKIHSVFIIISNFFQIILLITLTNYIAVLILQLLFRILENIYISKKANKLYPYLEEDSNLKLSIKEKKLFFESLYSILLYKISGVVINGTDNIIISLYIGVTYVGIYSNYFLIISTVSTFVGHIFYSITASVGNLNTTENTKRKYFIFRVLNFSNFWIFGFCSVCLWNLINPFIVIWLGQEFVFSKLIVLAIIINFFTAGMQNACTTFRETTGLFKIGKYRPIIAATINIIVSIILAKQIGIAGIFLGTVISRLCTYFWYDPYIIFRHVFLEPVKTHFIKYTYFTLLVLFFLIITDWIGSNIFDNSLIVNFLFRGAVCLIIPNLIIYLIFRKTEEFRYVLDIIKGILYRLSFRKSPSNVLNA